MGRLIGVILIGAAITAAPRAVATERFEFTQTEMAVPFRIVLYMSDAAAAREAAKAAFARIHALNAVLSDYDPESELRRLCDTSNEGNPVAVSADLWRVLARSQEIAERSEGAFDVTVGPLVRLWRSARRTKELPTARSLDKARSKVGYRLMRLDAERRTVELLRSKMRLDLGGIAKGYAVDEALGVLRDCGVERMMIDAGGNLGLGGPPPERSGWRVGLASPDGKSPPRQYLLLANCSLSTSGDLWQYAVIGGVRYSHLIDPRDGMALTGRMSATVVGPDGMTADGLSSAIAVLGPEKGLKLIENMKDVAAWIVREIDGKEEAFQSENWKSLSGSP